MCNGSPGWLEVSRVQIERNVCAMPLGVVAFYATVVTSTESGDVQNAQRRAAIATSLRHSGHFFVVGSGVASPRRSRAVSALTGSTTKKYTATPIIKNATSALTKSPIINLLPLTVMAIAEKSGLPATAAISGVSRSLTSAV